MTLLEYFARFCMLFTVVTIAGALWPIVRGAAAWVKWRRVRRAIRLEPFAAPRDQLDDQVLAPPLCVTAHALEMNAHCIAESREHELEAELAAELERAHDLVVQAARIVRSVSAHDGVLDAPAAAPPVIVRS